MIIGMTALAKTAVDSLRWAWHLRRGPIVRCDAVPVSKLPMIKARPDEIETKRPTAIPPDAVEVYGAAPSVDQPEGTVPLPILAT